jgi:hypothetical protein
MEAINAAEARGTGASITAVDRSQRLAPAVVRSAALRFA